MTCPICSEPILEGCRYCRLHFLLFLESPQWGRLIEQLLVEGLDDVEKSLLSARAAREFVDASRAA